MYSKCCFLSNHSLFPFFKTYSFFTLLSKILVFFTHSSLPANIYSEPTSSMYLLGFCAECGVIINGMEAEPSKKMRACGQSIHIDTELQAQQL